MKILFISRAYPPVVGGIENQNAELAKWLGREAEVALIANTRGKRFLPLFFPYALVRTLFTAGRYDVILLGDGVLAIIGFFSKLVHRKTPVASVIHGLDITYGNFLYRELWVKIFIPALDRLLAVSTATKAVAQDAGIPAQRITVIPNGVDIKKMPGEYPKSALEGILGRTLSGNVVLLTAGRLARRKGVAWFIERVLPSLDPSALYVVAGDGPDAEHIRQTVLATREDERVVLLGRVTEEDLRILLNTADIFVQPNIRVPGDMEGFGIAVIEAGSAGLPVVASSLEGLRDAVKDGANGILVPPEKPEGFIRAINELIHNQDERRLLGARAKETVAREFHWQSIAKRYLDTLTHLNVHP